MEVGICYRTYFLWRIYDENDNEHNQSGIVDLISSDNNDNDVRDNIL